jgi:hypothetical protein
MTVQSPAQPQVILQITDFRDQTKHGLSRHKFQKYEDELLRQLVEKYGDRNWNLISRFMSRRNARQCRERYKNYLSPNFRNSPWTADEEELLAGKVKEIGPKWSVIARLFEARSEVNVKNHWAAIMSRNERIQKYARAQVQQGEQNARGKTEPSQKDDEMWILEPIAATQEEPGDPDMFSSDENNGFLWD